MNLSRNTLPDVPVADYDQQRVSIMSGDLLLCSGNGVFGKMIKQMTNSVWTHVGLVYWFDQLERLMVIESVEGRGVRTVPLSNYLYNYNHKGRAYNGTVVIASDYRMRENWKPVELGEIVVNLLDCQYDNDMIARIAWRITTGRAREKQSDKEYICSEFVAESFEALGYDFPYDRRGFITPADIATAPTVHLEAVLHREE